MSLGVQHYNPTSVCTTHLITCLLSIYHHTADPIFLFLPCLRIFPSFFTIFIVYRILGLVAFYVCNLFKFVCCSLSTWKMKIVFFHSFFSLRICYNSCFSFSVCNTPLLKFPMIFYSIFVHDIIWFMCLFWRGYCYLYCLELYELFPSNSIPLRQSPICCLPLFCLFCSVGLFFCFVCMFYTPHISEFV